MSEEKDKYLDDLINKSTGKWEGVNPDVFMHSVRGGSFFDFQDILETLARVRRDAEAVPQLVAALRDLHRFVEHGPDEWSQEEYLDLTDRVRQLLKKYETK